MDSAQPVMRRIEGADAASRCRAFAAAELAGFPAETVEGVQLVLTELVTNAQLHGAPPILVGVTGLGDGGARVAVSDTGRRRLVVPAPGGPDSMTGRGLTMVAAVAETWGVDAAEGGGKVVWAVVRPGSSDVAEEPEVDLDALLAAWDDEPAEARYSVHLGPVPTRLLLDVRLHIDNVVRELTLLRPSARPEFVPSINVVTIEFAEVRAEVKECAAEAAARGARMTDLVLRLPASAAEAGQRYLDAFDEVDRYARTARILTLETPPLYRLFRQWYVGELVTQLTARREGRVPDEPTPFAEVLAREVEELSSLREAAFRLDLLQRMNAALAEAHTAEDLARTVLTAAVRELDAVIARVYVDTGDRLTAFGQGAAPDAAFPDYDEVSFDAQLPSAMVYRSGKPLVVRTHSRVGEQFPGLAGVYSSELALHVVPIEAGRRRLGVLGLAFPQTSRYDEPAQTRFMRALADVLAQGLLRIERVPGEQGRESPLSETL